MFDMIKYSSNHMLSFISVKWRVQVSRLMKVSDASLWWIVWGVITYLTSLVNSLFLYRCLEKVNVTLLLWLKALTLILWRVSARTSLRKLSASWKTRVKYRSTRLFFNKTMMMMHIFSYQSKYGDRSVMSHVLLWSNGCVFSGDLITGRLGHNIVNAW